MLREDPAAPQDSRSGVRSEGRGGGRKGKRETDKAIGRHKMERNVGALDKVR